MLKNCVECGAAFDVKTSAKVCSRECKQLRKKRVLSDYRKTPEYRASKNEYHRRQMLNPAYRERKKSYENSRMEDPAKRKRRNDQQCERQAELYKSPECRAYLNEQQRALYASDPKYRENARRRRYERMQDPEYREQQNEKKRTYEQGRRKDPKYRARLQASWNNYQARKKALPNTLTAAQWGYALSYFNGRCAVCERPLRDLFGTHTVAIDHWIPLTYEGDRNPGTVASNILPLCHGLGGCNNKKHAIMPEEWLVSEYGKRKATQILARIESYFEHIRGIMDNEE